MDGWMNGRMHGQMDRQTDKQTERLTKQTGRRTDRQIDTSMDMKQTNKYASFTNQYVLSSRSFKRDTTLHLVDLSQVQATYLPLVLDMGTLCRKLKGSNKAPSYASRNVYSKDFLSINDSQLEL